MHANADYDPKPTDQDRPSMDNKMSVLSCPQNALDDFPSARLSLARLCPHRALFCLTVRRPIEQPEGKKRMSFRAYATKNPGVWGGPQGALVARRQNNGNRKFTIFAILLLPNIKTVADPFAFIPSQSGITDRLTKAGVLSEFLGKDHCYPFPMVQRNRY